MRAGGPGSSGRSGSTCRSAPSAGWAGRWRARCSRAADPVLAAAARAVRRGQPRDRRRCPVRTGCPAARGAPARRTTSAYHDDEWGRPVHGEAPLFERISLEAFQSGLSWITILRKRPAFRAAFAGFDPAAVAAFDDGDVARLLADAGIVRNRRRSLATIANARGRGRARRRPGRRCSGRSRPSRDRPAPVTHRRRRRRSPRSRRRWRRR